MPLEIIFLVLISRIIRLYSSFPILSVPTAKYFWHRLNPVADEKYFDFASFASRSPSNMISSFAFMFLNFLQDKE